MPSWLCNCLPFLRSRRPCPSPAGSRHDEALPLPRIDSAPASPSPSRPSSRLGIPRGDINATATGASPLSVPGNSIDHQLSSADRHVGDRASEHIITSTQPSQVSRPVTPSGFVPPNAIQTLEPHGSGVEQPTFPASSNHTDSVQAQQLLAPPPPSLAATPSQQSLNPDPLIYSSQPQHRSQGLFNQAHDFIASGTFVDASTTYHNHTSNKSMEKLLKETIPGAEFDSSARDPPPRCHPGTRLDVLERCRHFVRTSNGKRRTRWVVGAAGVGKSAIMQSVVESPELAVNCRASVFFSINGRDDGTKAVATISYQLAVKSELYRQLIEREITRDPALLRSSMAKQFLKLIVEPFIHNPQLNSAGRALIVIDGLDECKIPRTQLELLRLISDLCIKYPSSPLVWLIASRPEQHITAFFSQSHVAATYEKEEIVVNSGEAREDVERYLHDKLTEIKKKASDTVDPRWPEEQDLWKLANAAGGLFAYAETAVRYIEDEIVWSPASQLSDVLSVIENHHITDVPPEEHPMASLDALYARILSNVSSKVMENTRKLLLALAFDLGVDGLGSFMQLCNWLGMTPDEAYAALNHLRSVLRVPRRGEAHQEKLELFHKSFMDYISDFRRSRFSRDINHEARQLIAQCIFRILNEASDGIDFGHANRESFGGILRQDPGTSAKISVTWPVREDVDGTDNETRFDIYISALAVVSTGLIRRDPTFQNEHCIHILSTCFDEYNDDFLLFSLYPSVFDGSRRQEFMMHGILKQMPVKAIDVSCFLNDIVRLRFRRSATTATKLSDPWNSACYHQRSGKWGEEDDQDWKTDLWLKGCDFCRERLERQWVDWKTLSPDHAVPIFFTSTGDCCVEFQFVDPEDGISEWTYMRPMKLALEECKKYGSIYNV